MMQMVGFLWVHHDKHMESSVMQYMYSIKSSYKHKSYHSDFMNTFVLLQI